MKPRGTEPRGTDPCGIKPLFSPLEIEGASIGNENPRLGASHHAIIHAATFLCDL